MSSTRITRNRYIRLMVISATEILGTIPLGTVWIVKAAKSGVAPWRGWTYTHENYSAVHQIPASVWKNNPNSAFTLEVYRWSLVLCAFLFFALFGFADEARQHYRRMYTSISRISYSTHTFLKSSQAYVAHSLCWFVRLIVTHLVFLAVRRRSLTRRTKAV
jgi:pheromone a factor receptor